MESKASQLLAFIQTLDVDDEEKQRMITIVSHEGATDEEIGKEFKAYLDEQSVVVSDKMAAELTPIYDEAEAELKSAEKEYNDTLKDLDTEAQKVLAEAGEEMAALPE